MLGKETESQDVLRRKILAGDNQPLGFIKKIKNPPRIGKIALVRKDFILEKQLDRQK